MFNTFDIAQWHMCAGWCDPTPIQGENAFCFIFFKTLELGAWKQGGYFEFGKTTEDEKLTEIDATIIRKRTTMNPIPFYREKEMQTQNYTAIWRYII